MTDAEKFERGIAEFNAGRFFEAHEVWEELWLVAAEPEKTFLQGLIQAAAAFHHLLRGNERGARSLVRAAVAKLGKCPDDFRDIAMGEFRTELGAWTETLGGSPRKQRKLPRIRTARSAGKEKRRNRFEPPRLGRK